MDVLKAAYDVAHDFPDRGAVGLAARLDKNAGTFLNELSPGCETAKLGLGTALAMTLATKDYRILYAFADTCGHLAFPKPDFSRVSDAALLDMFLVRDEAAGRFAETVRLALADGSVSRAELSRIRERAHSYAAAVLEIVARLEGLSDGR